MTLEEEVRRILSGENRKTYWEDLLEDLVRVNKNASYSSALKAMAIGVGGVLCVMAVLGLMAWPPAQPFFEAVFVVGENAVKGVLIVVSIPVVIVFELVSWLWQLFESEPSYPVLVEEYSRSNMTRCVYDNGVEFLLQYKRAECPASITAN